MCENKGLWLNITVSVFRPDSQRASGRVDETMRQTRDGRETGRTQISQDEEEEPNT